MKRRQFLKGAAAFAVTASVLGGLTSDQHLAPVPDYACHPKDIPATAVSGPCFVFRGTYAGWVRPGVPPARIV